MRLSTITAARPKIDFAEKVILFSAFAFFYGALYQYPNLFPPFEPVYLPLTWIDRAMPFWPWTFLIYVSDYLFALSVVLWVRDPADFYRLTRRIFIGLGLGGFFFFFLPTIYPRPEYPTDQPAILQWILDGIRQGDRPTNCFPSMHCAFTAIAFLSVPSRNRWVIGFFALWALGIFASTMTTKQHYFVDILGGVGVGWVAVRLEPRWERRMRSFADRHRHRLAWVHALRDESLSAKKKTTLDETRKRKH